MRFLSTLATLLLGLAVIFWAPAAKAHCPHGSDVKHCPGEPGATLGDLECSSGQVAKYDEPNWVCAADEDTVGGFKDQGGAVRGATSVAVRTTDLNITGNYSFIETVTSSTCPGTVPGQQDIFSVAASQSGQNLTLIEDHGTVLTGTLIGTSIAVQGTLIEPVSGTSCVITDNISFNATVNPTTLDLSGTATEFIFSNAPSLCGGFASCTVNTAVVATRLSGASASALEANSPGEGFIGGMIGLPSVAIPGH